MLHEPIAEPSLLQRAVLPVLDLMGGHVVRGVGGRRSEYRPIVSTLTPSSMPLAVANALRDNFGFERFYVADLDAITTGSTDEHSLQALTDAGFKLIVDAGISKASAARRLLDFGVSQIVLGLESLASPVRLDEILKSMSPQLVVFSLDLKDGHPMADSTSWPDDPQQIVDIACAAGVHHVIVLDLAAVGMRGGLSTATLCRDIRARHPRTTIVTGGGIRTAHDIEHAIDCGANTVLVATALHDGSLHALVRSAS